MSSFTKTHNDHYELVFDYSKLLTPGEVIRGYNVSVNGTPISGVLSDGSIEDIFVNGNFLK